MDRPQVNKQEIVSSFQMQELRPIKARDSRPDGWNNGMCHRLWMRSRPPLLRSWGKGWSLSLRSTNKGDRTDGAIKGRSNQLGHHAFRQLCDHHSSLLEFLQFPPRLTTSPAKDVCHKKDYSLISLLRSSIAAWLTGTTSLIDIILLIYPYTL